MDDLLQKFINKGKRRADEYSQIIEGMMGDYSAYHYAEGTLLGILDYIEDNDAITDAQVEAIENIKQKPSKGYGR